MPLYYGFVEAVLLAVFCLYAWKAGWTFAPPSAWRVLGPGGGVGASGTADFLSAPPPSDGGVSSGGGGGNGGVADCVCWVRSKHGRRAFCWVQKQQQQQHSAALPPPRRRRRVAGADARPCLHRRSRLARISRRL